MEKVEIVSLKLNYINRRRKKEEKKKKKEEERKITMTSTLLMKIRIKLRASIGLYRNGPF